MVVDVKKTQGDGAEGKEWCWDKKADSSDAEKDCNTSQAGFFNRHPGVNSIQKRSVEQYKIQIWVFFFKYIWCNASIPNNPLKPIIWNLMPCLCPSLPSSVASVIPEETAAKLLLGLQGSYSQQKYLTVNMFLSKCKLQHPPIMPSSITPNLCWIVSLKWRLICGFDRENAPADTQSWSLSLLRKKNTIENKAGKCSLRLAMIYLLFLHLIQLWQRLPKNNVCLALLSIILGRTINTPPFFSWSNCMSLLCWIDQAEHLNLSAVIDLCLEVLFCHKKSAFWAPLQKFTGFKA